MPVPWLQVIDAALGVANFARGRKSSAPAPDGPLQQVEPGGQAPGGLEARLAGVVVAAWIGTLVLSARLTGGGVGARVSLGVGWLFLLGAIAASFTAQSRA